MFRKMLIAFAATASLGAAALPPTAASAAPHGHGYNGGHGFHGHWGGGWRGGHRWGGPRWGWGGPRFVGGGFYGPCRWVQRPVLTPIGPQFRWVRVCYY